MILIDFKVVGEFIRSCLPRQKPRLEAYLHTLLTYLLTLLIYTNRCSRSTRVFCCSHLAERPVDSDLFLHAAAQ